MPTDGRTPFIMPDGRRLSHFLNESGLLHEEKRSRGGKKGKRNGERKWEPPAAGSQPAPRTVVVASSELEHVELQALNKVGARRRLRWLNDKLLRDMAGPLTAADMENLFKPVPFGYAHESAISQAVAPDNAAVWSHFVSINPDKERRVLEKWEAHMAQLSERASRPGGPALEAITRWSRVSRRARTALKSASPLLVAELEASLLPLLEEDQGLGTSAASQPAQGDARDASAQGGAASAEGGDGSESGSPTSPAPLVAAPSQPDTSGSGGEDEASSSSAAPGGASPGGAHSVRYGADEVALLLPDAFQRLLVHGMAEYHGLVSFSRDGSEGRVLVVRRHRAAGDGGGSSSSKAVVQGPGRCELTVADLMFLLEDETHAGSSGGGSLTAAALKQLLAERAAGHTSCDELTL